MSKFFFSVQIAGITMRFDAPEIMEIPRELRPFLTEQTDAQEVFEIELIDTPLTFENSPVFSSSGQVVYSENGDSTRVFWPLKAPDGCMPTCRLRRNGRNTIYLPRSDWGRYERSFSLSVLLGPEAVFLRHNGMILHSSVVRCDGYAILFSGASGAGKSTQAELWQTYRKGDILNGDRCILIKRQDGFYGCGSPYCGSSGIYRQEEAPIRAIILPEKATENCIERLEPEKAFRRLYRELLLNLWDVEFVERILDLLQELVLQVPVYCLSCRPDQQATELTYQAVFGG